VALLAGAVIVTVQGNDCACTGFMFNISSDMAMTRRISMQLIDEFRTPI
jgi:hypothetical protein